MTANSKGIVTLVNQITEIPLNHLRSHRAKRSSLAEQPEKEKRSYKAPLRLGVMVCALVVFGFGSWSVFASISGAVVATGKVSVDGQVQTVQHLDGGVVAEILTRDGDTVREGSLLLRLDAVGLSAELAIGESRLLEAIARRARLEAERDGVASPAWPAALDALDLDRRRRTEIVSDADNLGNTSNTDGKKDRQEKPAKPVDRSGTQSPNKDANRVFEAEVRLFRARNATRAAQVKRLNKSIGQAREQIAGLKEQRKSRRRQQDLIKQELKGAKKLHKDGLSPLTRLLALQRQVSEIDGAMAALTAEVAATGQQIGQLEVEILKVEKDWQEKVLVDLRSAHLEIRELMERRTSILDKLKRVELRAPVSGTVNNLAANTVGGVIRAAEPVLDIVPAGERLIIEAFVSPAQIDRIHEGQLARVRLSAFNANTTPELRGSLVHVSADLIEDKEARTQSYLVRVRIPKSEIAKLEDKRLIPGMPADLFMETGSRSPLSFLLKPLSDQVARANKER